MNHVYRSIWNTVTRTFVAVAENAQSRGRKVSSNRSARRAASDAPGDGASANASAMAPPRPRSVVRPMALEPRLMFDAAALSTAVHAEAHTDATSTATADTGHADALAAAAAKLTEAAASAAAAGTATSNATSNAPASTAATTPHEVVFIETSVADWQALAAGVDPSAKLVLLDPAKDGLTQMVAALQGMTGVDSIQVLSHGSEGEVNLGSFTLDTATVAARSSDLAAIGASLSPGGDLLFYGCSVAGGTGQGFIQALATATGADVAASTTRTGAATSGGDWTLEASTGPTETRLAISDGARDAFRGGLDDLTVYSINALTTALQNSNYGDVIHVDASLGSDIDLHGVYCQLNDFFTLDLRQLSDVNIHDGDLEFTHLTVLANSGQTVTLSTGLHGSSLGGLTLEGGTFSLQGDDSQLQGTVRIQGNAVLSVGNVGELGSANIDLNGGTLSFTNSSGLVFSGQFTLDASSTISLDGAAPVELNGIFTSDGANGFQAHTLTLASSTTSELTLTDSQNLNNLSQTTVELTAGISVRGGGALGTASVVTIDAGSMLNLADGEHMSATVNLASNTYNGAETTALTTSGSAEISGQLNMVGNGTLGATGGEGSTLTLSGGIGGTGTLTVVDSSEVILSGDGSGFTGSIQLQSGELHVTDPATLALASGVDIGEGTTLHVDSGSLDVLLSGAGTVTKTDSGILSLTNVGNYASWMGRLEIEDGTLSVADGAAMPDGFVSMANATTLLVTASTTFNSGLSTGDQVKIQTNAQLILNGFVNGSGDLIKTGGNTLVVLGTSQSNHHGDLIVQEGGLSFSGGGPPHSLGFAAQGMDRPTIYLEIGTTLTLGQHYDGPTFPNTQVEANIVLATGAHAIAVGSTISGEFGQYVTLNTATVRGTVTGSGALTKTGVGTVSFNGGLTNTGGLTVLGGVVGGSGELNASESVTLNGGGLAWSTSHDIFLGASGGTLTGGTYSGVISGDGNLNVGPVDGLFNQGYDVVLSGANTYTGTTTVNHNTTLEIDNGDALGSIDAGTTVQDGATLKLDDGVDLVENIVLAGTGSSNGGDRESLWVSSGSATISGDVTLTGAATIDVDTSSHLTLSGLVSGAYDLTKSGTGVLSLGGNSNYFNWSGNLNINAGTLSIADGNALIGGGVNLADQTTLVVTGSTVINTELNTSGTVTLQVDDQAQIASDRLVGFSSLVKTGSGTLVLVADNLAHHAGDLRIAAGGLSIAGLTPEGSLGTDAGGHEAPTITLGDATMLTLADGVSVHANIVLEAGAQTIAVGGDSTLNQDVRTDLAYVATVAGTITGAGALTKVDVGQVSFSALANTGGLTVTGGTVSGSLGSTGTETVTLDGGGLDESGQTVTQNIVLGTNGGTLDGGTYTGIISGSGGLHIDVFAMLKPNYMVDSSVTLSGSNTYAGATTVHHNATLEIANDQALGSTTGETTVLSGGTLQLDDGIELAENLTLDGAGSGNGAPSEALRVASGNATITGAVTLAGWTTIGVGSSGRLTLDGLVSGAFNLSKAGAGLLVLQRANTYTGQTYINAGTLEAANNTALGSVSGATAVDSGATLRLADGVDTAENITISGTGDTASRGQGALSVYADTPGNLAATLSGTLTLAGDATIGVGWGETLIVSGNIAGAGHALSKSDGGALSLTGQNVYGATAVVAGTLSVGQALALGSGTLTLSSGSTLALADGVTASNAIILGVGGGRIATAGSGTTAALSGVISGAGTLDKIGAGTLTLANTGNSAAWSGGLVVNAGAVGIASDAGVTSGTITLDGGQLTLQNFSGSTLDNAITLGAAGGTVNAINSAAMASGAITGSGRLSKTGGQQLTLTGTNTYSGGTTISGTNGLAVNDGHNLGSGTVTINTGLKVLNSGVTVSNDIVLGTTDSTVTTATSLTLSGTLSGDSLSKLGAGGLTLTGTNSYTGITTVSGGSLLIAGDANLGTGTAAVALAAGVDLIITGSGTIDNDIVFDESATIENTGAVTLSGALIGSGEMSKLGAGTLTLTNTANRDGLTGGVRISDGVLAVGADDALVGGTVSLNGGSLSLTGSIMIDNDIELALDGTITAQSGATATFTGEVSGTSALTLDGPGTVALAGINSHSGAVNITAGGLTISGSSSIGDSSRVTVSTGATLTLGLGTETIGSLAGAGNVVLGYRLTTGGDNTSTTFSGVISGARIGITKDGSGTFTLSGANSFSGATTVSAGGLTLSNGASIADTSAVTVAAGATLRLQDGNETIASLAGAGTVTLHGGSLTLAGNGSTAFSGVIQDGSSGSQNLIKQGSGTLTLSGANTYGGTTTVSGGSLVAGSNAALGSTAGGTTVASGATLALAAGVSLPESLTLSGTGDNGVGALAVIDGNTTTPGVSGAITLADDATIGVSASTSALTLSGGISGAHALTKTGAGTLALSGSNTYTGNTVISAGTLAVSGGAAIADTSAVIATGTLLLNADEAIGSLSGSGGVTLGAHTLTTGGDNSSTTFSGVVSGTGALVKTGSGTFTLSGTNTYTGSTEINGGVLSVAASANLGAGALRIGTAGLTVTAAASLGNDIVILSGAAATITDDQALTLSGALSGGSGSLTKSGTGVLTLSHTANASFGGSTVVANGGLAIATAANLGSGALTLGSTGHAVTLSIAADTTLVEAITLIDAAAVAIATGASVTVSGPVSGSGGLTKQGAGKLTLNGTDTYAGSTVVDAGTLQVDGALSGTSDLSVSSGATLAGSGSIGTANSSGAVTITSGGTVAPGDSGTRVLTLNDGLTIQAGGTFAAQVGGATAGSGYDQLAVTGAIDVSGATLTLDTTGYTPVVSDHIALIVGDATHSVTGAFSGLGEGVSAGTANGRVLDASYAGHGFALSTPNAVPQMSGLNGDSVSFAQNGAAVQLDAGGNATFSDLDGGDFASGNVTASISANRVSGEDVLTVRNDGILSGQIGVSGANVTFGGAVIGTLSGGTGHADLVVALNANASAAAVQALIRNLSYANTNAAGIDTATRTVTVTVSDGLGGTSTNAHVSVAVTNVNHAPSTGGLTAQSATQGAAFTFTVPGNAFADVDQGDSLTLSATLSDGSALPTWLSFNASTGAFTGTPANADVGELTVRVTATDTSHTFVNSDFALTVANVNDTPTATSIASQSATQGAAFSFVVPSNTFNDIDVGDHLTLTATLSDGSALPTWLSFNASTGAFTGTPANADVGALTVRVTATDSSHTSVNSDFALTVANVNDTPTAVPIASQSATQGAAFSFVVPSNTFNDIDVGDHLTLTATLSDGSALPTWLSFNASTGTFTGTPGNADTGALAVRVTATDTSQASASSAFSVAIIEIAHAPTVATPPAIQLTDTAAADTFQAVTGQLQGSSTDLGATLHYGIDGGSVTSATVIGGQPYDVQKAGSFGTLWLNDSTGQYVYIVNSAAVNAASAAAAESFGLTVSVGQYTSHTALAIDVAGVDDAPQGSIAVAGQPQVGQVLRAATGTLTDAEGVGSVAVRWQMQDPTGHWANVAGAQGNSLLLDDALMGHAVRAVAIVTDGSGQSLEIASTASAAVQPLPLPLPQPIVPPPVAAPPSIAASLAPLPFASNASTRSAADAATAPNSFASPISVGSFGGAPTIGSFSAQVPDLHPTQASIMPMTATGQPADTASREAAPSSLASPFISIVANPADASGGPAIKASNLDAISVAAGAPLQFTLPTDTFSVSAGGPALGLDVRQADGSPLPGWLKFDVKSGKFSGQAPEGFAGTIHVLIFVKDAKGHSAATQLDIRVGVDDAKTGALAPIGHPAQRHVALHSRPGLSTQLRTAHLGRFAHLTQADLGDRARAPRL